MQHNPLERLPDEIHHIILTEAESGAAITS